MKVQQGVLVIHVVGLQHLLSAIIDLVVQYGQEKMLYLYRLYALQASLQHGQLEDVVCLLAQGRLGRTHRHRQHAAAQPVLQLHLHRMDVDGMAVKHVFHSIGLVAKYAQQQVLGGHFGARQAKGFLTAESEHLGYFG